MDMDVFTLLAYVFAMLTNIFGDWLLIAAAVSAIAGFFLKKARANSVVLTLLNIIGVSALAYANLEGMETVGYSLRLSVGQAGLAIIVTIILLAIAYYLSSRR